MAAVAVTVVILSGEPGSEQTSEPVPSAPVAIADGLRPGDNDAFADDGATLVGSIQELQATDATSLPARIHGIGAPGPGADDEPLTTVVLQPEEGDGTAATGSAPPVSTGSWLPDGRLIAADLTDQRGGALLVGPDASDGGEAAVDSIDEPLHFGLVVGSDTPPDRVVGVHATTGEVLVVAADDPLELLARDVEDGTSRRLGTVAVPPHDEQGSAADADGEAERREIAAAHADGDTVVAWSTDRGAGSQNLVPGADPNMEVPTWMHLGSDGDELDAVRPLNADWPVDDAGDVRNATTPRIVATDDGPLVVTAENAAIGPLEVVLTDPAGHTRVAMRLEETRDDGPEPAPFRYALDRRESGPLTSMDVHKGQVLLTGADPVDAVPDDTSAQAPTSSFVGDQEVIGTSLVLDLTDGSVTRLDALAGPTSTAFVPQ